MSVQSKSDSAIVQVRVSHLSGKSNVVSNYSDSLGDNSLTFD